MKLSLWDPGQVGGGRPPFLSPATDCGPTISPIRGFYCLMPCGGLQDNASVLPGWGLQVWDTSLSLRELWLYQTRTLSASVLATQNQHSRSEKALLPALRPRRESLLDAESLMHLFASQGSTVHQRGLLVPPPQGQSSQLKAGLASLPEGAVYLTEKG